MLISIIEKIDFALEGCFFHIQGGQNDINLGEALSVFQEIYYVLCTVVISSIVQK